jgi:hypothetical protein
MYLQKQSLGIYVHLGTKLLDVLILSSGQSSVKVPLTGPHSKDKLIITVKSLDKEEARVGSISIF